ncbi:hypothetical protein JNK13_09380 [bacterium]|nr:hypothetical protein [bacterium]
MKAPQLLLIALLFSIVGIGNILVGYSKLGEIELINTETSTMPSKNLSTLERLDLAQTFPSSVGSDNLKSMVRSELYGTGILGGQIFLVFGGLIFIAGLFKRQHQGPKDS